MLDNSNNPLLPQSGKQYKLFLVEVDDEDRERVLAGIVGDCEITVEHDYLDIHSDYSEYPVAHYRASETVECTLRLLPASDGTYFRLEDFTKEEE